MISVPTGITTNVYRNKVVVSWVKNPEVNVVGYNIYNSTTSGGGISGYTKLNSALIEEYSAVETQVASSTQEIIVIGGVRTTTTVDNLVNVYIFSYEHNNLTESTEQFYVVTAVDNTGLESAWSIEVGATPLIISTEIFTPALRTQNDVSLDYITTLLTTQPKLDVKPASVTRQLHIDPNSYEFSLAYIREDYSSKAQSFLTLRIVDSADGSGVSDPVSSSTYKQSIKKAYFFTTDEDTQSFIDASFDKIAANYNKYRKGATFSNVNLVFYTYTPITKDITIPLGTQVSTMPSDSIVSIVFETLADVTMSVNTISNYYNPMTSRYEISVAAQSMTTGLNTNVNSDTIVASTIAGLSVTNPLPAFNGLDKETNSDLADRAELSFVGLDEGTEYGYERTARETIGTEDVIVVLAGDTMMQRDYDEVRKKHVFGKVDVYVRGGTIVQVQDTFGFLYNKITDEQVAIIDPVDMLLNIINPIVTTKPVYTILEIRNISKAKNYDLLGNWRVFKNSVEMVKGIDVTVDLTTGVATFTNTLTVGDVITASYDYKVTVTGEVLMNSAIGGEVNFIVANIPILKRSYSVIKNGITLVESVDYALNIFTGSLLLTGAGLATGDNLTINYQYKVSVVLETIVPSALGNEISAPFANSNVLESFVIDGTKVDLEQTNYYNTTIGMLVTDVVTATYRYRDSNPYVMATQPVMDVSSVTGSISGVLTPNVNWFFNKVDDVLLEGNSTKAVRNINIVYANNVPAGGMFSATDSIVLVDNGFKPVSNKGVDVETLIVKDNIKTYAKNIDYIIQPETSGVNLMIARTIVSTIPNGNPVSVSYDYGELITVVYTVPQLVETVQTNVSTKRHVTADVLVKYVMETNVDYIISVILKKGSDEIAMASDIKDAIANRMAKLKTGQGLAQSDIVASIEAVTGVISVVIPLTKMVKADGTFINREPIYTPFIADSFNVVQSYTSGIDKLIYQTLGSNGNDGFYAVFQNDRPLKIVASAGDVDTASGQAFISSQGEIVISTIDSDSPDSYRFTVSYVVTGETGGKDIPVEALEHLNPGNISIITSILS